MRKFIQYNTSTGRVFATLDSERLPGPDPENLPGDMVEVTDRTDGPFADRTYNPALDKFGGPTYAVTCAVDKTQIAADATELATVRFRADDAGANGPIAVIVDGEEYEFAMLAGVAELQLASAVPTSLSVAIKPSDLFRGTNGLTIKAV